MASGTFARGNAVSPPSSTSFRYRKNVANLYDCRRYDACGGNRPPAAFTDLLYPFRTDR